jgi:hypothetical protein
MKTMVFLLILTIILIPSCTQPIATPNPISKYEITANEARTFLNSSNVTERIVVASIADDNTTWYGFKSLDEAIATLDKWETVSEDIEVNAVCNGHTYFETFPDAKSAASWLGYIKSVEKTNL